MKAIVKPEFLWLPEGAEAQLHVLTTLVAEEEGGSTSVRPPISLALVIDASGSMEGKPLDQMKKAIREVLTFLTRRDRVTCIVFGDQASRVFPLIELTDKSSLGEKIEAISTIGYTNLSAGWLMGIDEIRQAYRKDHINRLFLLTDGQINRGVTDPGALQQIAEKASQTGITTSTFGFGDNFQEGILKEIAQSGGGNFHYIRLPEDTALVFRIEFGEMSRLAGQNGKIRIHFAGGVDIVEELTILPFRDESRTRIYSLGDVLFGIDRQLLFRLRFGKRAAGEKAEIFRGNARFLSVTKGFEPDETEFSFAEDFRVSSERPPVDQAVLDQVVLAKTAVCKQQAFLDWESGERGNAIQALTARSQIIRDRLKDPQAVMKEALEGELLLVERLIIDLQGKSAQAGKNIQAQVEDFAKKRGSYIQARHEKTYNVSRDLPAKDPEERVAFAQSVHQALSDLGLEAEFLTRCRTVFDELLANSMEHGCRNYPGASVKISAQFSRSRGVLKIKDPGQGFNYPTVLEQARNKFPSPVPARNRGGLLEALEQAADMNVRGRGLPMVLATGCEIEYSGNGNEVTARLFNRLPEGIVTSDSVAVSKDRGPRTRIEVRNLVMKGHLVGVLEIEGEIDVYSLSLLKEQARNLLDRGINHILIDVESLDYIDSSGLGFFVGTQQLCQNLGGCLVIAKPTSYIQRLFGTILSEKIVPVIYSEQELENFLSDSTI